MFNLMYIVDGVAVAVRFGYDSRDSANTSADRLNEREDGSGQWEVFPNY